MPLIAAGSTTASRQSLINSNPNGTSFCLASGLHTATGSNIPKTGNTFTGQFGAIIDGTGWSPIDHDDAFFKGLNNGVTGVTIRNLVLRNGPEYGVNSYLTASGWTVDHCEIHHNRNGVSVGKSGVISNNWIHHNVGVINSPTTALRGGGIVLNSSLGAQIINNEVSFNGQEQKFIYGTTNEPNQNLYIAGNYYHDNIWDGIWIDGDGAGSIIENNRSENNGRTGMTLEIANNVTVRNNTMLGNAEEGLLISATRGSNVIGNIIDSNRFGIGLFLDFARLQEIYPFWTVDLINNTMSNNIVRVPGVAGTNYAALLTFIGTGNQTPYLNNTKQNVFIGTAYTVSNPSLGWFVWNGTKTFQQWQALPQDAGATINGSTGVADLGGFRPQFPPSYGMNGSFGRGDGTTVPVIYKVNTLNCEAPAVLASGSGTRSDPFIYTAGLRAALTAAQQRVVVFTISGNITVATPIFVTTPYMTVAGQTAPSPGITLTAGDYTGSGGAGVIEINTHDVLLQHFRVRGGVAGYSNIGVWDERPFFGTRPFNVVFDHISASQGMDENFYGDADDYCFWRCLAGESLYGNDIDSQGPSAGHGFLSIDSQRTASIGCLAISCGRGPEIHDFTSVFVGDFVSHNGCGPSNLNNPAASLWYQAAAGASLGTYINYRAKQGPSTPNNQAAVYYYIDVAGSQIYLEDCTVTGTYVPFRFNTRDPRVGTAPVPRPTGWTSVGSANLETWIAANVGARPRDRDSVDTRYITELQAGSGQWVHSPQAIPTLASNPATWTLPLNPFVVTGPYGRTNFDLWAETLAQGLEP